MAHGGAAGHRKAAAVPGVKPEPTEAPLSLHGLEQAEAVRGIEIKWSPHTFTGACVAIQGGGGTGCPERVCGPVHAQLARECARVMQGGSGLQRVRVSCRGWGKRSRGRGSM